MTPLENETYSRVVILPPKAGYKSYLMLSVDLAFHFTTK